MKNRKMTAAEMGFGFGSDWRRVTEYNGHQFSGSGTVHPVSHIEAANDSGLEFTELGFVPFANIAALWVSGDLKTGIEVRSVEVKA